MDSRKLAFMLGAIFIFQPMMGIFNKANADHPSISLPSISFYYRYPVDRDAVKGRKTFTLDSRSPYVHLPDGTLVRFPRALYEINGENTGQYTVELDSDNNYWISTFVRLSSDQIKSKADINIPIIPKAVNLNHEYKYDRPGTKLEGDWKVESPGDLKRELGHSGCRDAEFLRELIRRGASTSDVAISGSALHSSECDEFLLYLLSIQPDIVSDLFRSAVPSERVSDERTVYYIELGANTEFTFHNNYSSLMYAAIRGKLNTMSLLIKNDLDINSQNKFGDTALHMAVRGIQLEAARLLVSNGADKTIKDNDNLTALQLAEDMRKGNKYFQKQMPGILELLGN